MDQLLRLPVGVFARLRDGLVRSLYWHILRFTDVLIAPWLLDDGALYQYLSARITSLLVPFCLTILGAKVFPQLSILSHAQDKRPFQAAAARVNLGYLMICGSASLFVLLAAPYLAIALRVFDTAYEEILIWLVIGQAAPVLFGATRLLMRVTDRGVLDDLMSGMTAALFLIGLAILSVQDGVLMAQTLAASQLTQAAVCALFLTRSGVWPALTALLHKEIKLF